MITAKRTFFAFHSNLLNQRDEKITVQLPIPHRLHDSYTQQIRHIKQHINRTRSINQSIIINNSRDPTLFLPCQPTHPAHIPIPKAKSRDNHNR